MKRNLFFKQGLDPPRFALTSRIRSFRQEHTQWWFFVAAPSLLSKLELAPEQCGSKSRILSFIRGRILLYDALMAPFQSFAQERILSQYALMGPSRSW